MVALCVDEGQPQKLSYTEVILVFGVFFFGYRCLVLCKIMHYTLLCMLVSNFWNAHIRISKLYNLFNIWVLLCLHLTLLLLGKYTSSLWSSKPTENSIYNSEIMYYIQSLSDFITVMGTVLKEKTALIMKLYHEWICNSTYILHWLKHCC